MQHFSTHSIAFTLTLGLSLWLSGESNRLSAEDCNGNGVDDAQDILQGTSPDCNENRVPDECEGDCNGNGIPDGCEIDPDLRFIRIEDAGGFSTGFSTGSYHGTAADLDGDGDLDLATANRTSDNVSVALNRGDGTFHRVSRFPAEDGPMQVAAADIDGDGDLDLATANAFSEDVTVLLNDGEARFTFGASLAVGYHVEWVVAADLDRDGSIDLATANGVRGEDGVWANDIAVFLNDGRGGFDGPPRRYPAGRRPCFLASADIDGDGDLDLATANSESGDVSVFRNQGDGSFAAQLSYAVGEWPMSLAMADLQGDGRVDLAVLGRKDITVLLNGGGGDFGAAPHCTLEYTSTFLGAGAALVALDVDGDGDVDLVTDGSWFGSPHILAFLNAGDGTFGFTLALPMPHSFRVLVADDLDKNGLADLAIVNTEEGFADAVTVLLNYGSPDANQNGIPDGCEEDCNGNRIPDEVDIGAGSSDDCNHDSVPDECEVRRVLEGFREVQVATVAQVAGGPVTLADLDGDGSLDLVATTEGWGLGVFRNDGAGGFKETQRLDYDPMNYSAGDYVGADLNGDGAMDLAGRNQNGRLSIFFSDGDGRLQDPVEESNSGVDSLAAGDFDGDGDIDLATVYPGSRLTPLTSVYVRWNEGNGTFGPSQRFQADAYMPSYVVAVDFDGDGDLDLATKSFRMLLNDGKKGFARSFPVGEIGVVTGDKFGFADMDDDGDMDLVGASVSSELIHVCINRGDGNFRVAWDGTPLPIGLPATGIACSSIGVTDLDGDGDIDLLYGTGSSLGVFWNEGDATFAGPETFDMAVSCVTTGDLDGDGFPDLATVAPSGLLTVWLGQHGYPLDCNRNGVPDPCDIAGGMSKDIDANGVPDECEITEFIRGDSNDDGKADISDAVFILTWLFVGGKAPGCIAAANVNGDVRVDISDPVSLLGHLFLGGPAPAEPFPECGRGEIPADATLGCLTQPKSCQ